jgi:hypothetical protein
LAREPLPAAAPFAENPKEKPMRRILPFGLLGSTIWAVAGLIALDLLIWGLDMPRDVPIELIKPFPIAFVGGRCCALGIGLLDFILAKLKIDLPYRVVATQARLF